MAEEGLINEERYRSATVGWLCVDCGALVQLPDAHDRWHLRLDAVQDVAMLTAQGQEEWSA